MIAIALLDDNAIEAKRTVELASAFLDQCNIAYAIELFTSGDSLLRALSVKTYDIYLLDVILEDNARAATGIDIARAIRAKDKQGALLFTTISLEHAPLGYGIDAVSYLLKPLDEAAFREALLKTLQLKRARMREPLTVKTATRIIRFRPEEILYFEVRDHTLSLQFADGHRENVSCSLSMLRDQLDECDFVTCHRSYIVQINAIRSLSRHSLLLINNEQIPISKYRYKDVQRALLERAERKATSLFGSDT